MRFTGISAAIYIFVHPRITISLPISGYDLHERARSHREMDDRISDKNMIKYF